MNSVISNLQASVDEMLQLVDGLSEDLLRWKPSEEKWSIIEVLCHVEEAIPYWLRELHAAIQSPGSEWGRGLQHEGRLAAVAQAGQRSLSEAVAGVCQLKEEMSKQLASVQMSDLQKEAPSRNPRFGTKPLQFIVDHLLVEHLQTHVEQIKRNLRQYAEAGLSNTH
ncbi:DinB family protein [Brevibacillus ruminantium]|uniref:DinB family protein n=1 Tax=Brevibacillus ruminantium TaxID=2950604 RepID=A0ABY4WAZ0_9BACL|nr:DinB family protein [Brevibacillus ruminantium]USG64335.1 DinB family protein [Brevibacillus ruminantium]